MGVSIVALFSRFLGRVIILGDLTYESNTCLLMLFPPVFNPCMRC